MEQLHPDAGSICPVSHKESRLEYAQKHFPYWVMPLLCASVWFSMLWAMMIFWLAQGQPRYSSMSGDQYIAYISDVGANVLKPLFITGSVITAAGFIFSLAFMRRNHALRSRLERLMDVFALASGTLGGISLILLASFDTQRFPQTHKVFLLLYMAGVIFSAVFTTVEYGRLGSTYQEYHILRVSYWAKIGIIIAELGLSLGFGVCVYQKRYNPAAVIEWLVAFFFTFYVLSFFYDLRPKARTKECVFHKGSNRVEMIDRTTGNHQPPSLTGDA